MSPPSLSAPASGGPLAGLKVLELGGIGPGPFCCMLLADMGAQVLRIERKETAVAAQCDPNVAFDLYARNKRSAALDLKRPEGVATVLKLVAAADFLVDPFRPGVLERLGLGPEALLRRNPRLVIGRMTGWGQEGPLAQAAGHDLNYIALTGALHSIGRPGERPVPPLNLVGDFGGGALYLAFGLLCAHAERMRSGRGQVVDAAMVDGAASLMTGVYGYLRSGRWTHEQGRNFLDGGAPYYDTYATSDGRHVAIAPVEPHFYAELLRRLGIPPDSLPPQGDRARAEELRGRLAVVFATRTRAEWCELLEGTDTCFAPVLDLDEAPRHPHNLHRQVWREFAGVLQPGPAPRLSRTPGELRTPPPARGQHTREAMRDWGVAADEVQALLDAGVAWQSPAELAR